MQAIVSRHRATAIQRDCRSAVNDHPFPSIQKCQLPASRSDFNYGIDDKTEIRGGVGFFADLYPAGFLDGVIQNFPNYNTETAFSGALSDTGAGSAGAYAAAQNAAVQSGFTSGEGIGDINNALYAQGRSVLASRRINAYFPGEFKVPEYLEYSLQVQRQLSRSDAIIVTYAGNYGYDGVLRTPI